MYHGISRFSVKYRGMYRGVPEAIYRNSLGLLVQHIKHVKCVGVGQFICYSSITKISLKKIDSGCPVLLFFLFFPIFSGLPIFSYILIPNPIFFHQIPIFFKMLQIIMKYQGKIMEFWFEMPVLMSLAFIFFLARFARS